MAGDGSDDFEPKDAVSPLPPRREAPLIEGKAEPEEGSELGEQASPAGMAAASPAAEREASIGAATENIVPPPKKSGGAALPLSIFFGAIIAVGGAFGLHYYDTSSSAVGEFQSRLDALAEKTDALSGVSGKIDSLSAVETSLAEKVAALEAAASKPAEAAQNEGGEQAFDDLQKRLSTLEASVAALPKAEDNAPANTAPDADLQKKLATLQDAVDSSVKATASLQTEVQKIADGQKALAEKPSGALPTVNLAPLDARLTKLEGKLSSFESTLTEEKTAIRAVQDKQATPPPVVNLAPLDTRLSKLEGSLPPVEASLTDVKTNIHAIQDKLAAPPPGQDQNAAIVAMTLLQRVQQGLPFETELAALGTLNIDPAKLSTLKTSAAKGVASAHKLSEDFRQLAPSIIKESEKSPPGQSFLDRLAGDAAHLVRIERVGDQTSVDVPSLINRIEVALDQNDVDGAYALWTQLPAPEKAISAAFGDAMKTRLEIVSTSWSIATDAVANLSKPKS